MSDQRMQGKSQSIVAASASTTGGPEPGPDAEVQAQTRKGRWPLLGLRTDERSFLHHPKLIKAGPLVLCLTVAATWLPMLLLAAAAGTPLTTRAEAVKLPFLHDLNVAFMFFVTLPMVVWMLLRDQSLLIDALRTVQREETLSVEHAVARTLVTRWNAIFKRINTQALVLPVMLGLGVAWLNHRVYSPPELGHWMSLGGATTAAGWWFLVCMGIFYAVTAFYVLRSLAIWRFLHGLARVGTVRPLPLHPDGSGGLRPIGEMGLRNQYLLTVFGVNLILLAFTSKNYFEDNTSLMALVQLAGAAYLVIGPLVFIAPLLPFRGAMLRTKVEVKSQVALRLRHELRRIRDALPQGEIVKADEEIIDRLRKFAAVVDELPVWPFDAGTLKKFTAAYMTPVIAFLVGLQDLLKYGGQFLEWSKGLLPL